MAGGYDIGLAISDSSGAANSGAASGGGGGGTKYQIVSGGGLSGLTPKQLTPIVIGIVAVAVLIVALFFRK